MATQSKNPELTRDAILKLLTDVEVARISRAEGATRLIEGDEYIDLTDPAAGVQLVQATPRDPAANALPRSAVSDATWAKIVQTIAIR